MLRTITATLTMTAALLVGPGPARADTICGNELDDWVPVTSVWLMEAFINGNPQNSTVTFTQTGQTAETAVVDPAGVFFGLYAHIAAANELDWFAADAPNTGDRFTYFATAVTCDVDDRILTASGPVAQFNVGVVGSLYMTRVA